jgi:LysM repeat protein
MKRSLQWVAWIIVMAALTGCTRFFGTPPAPAATVSQPTIAPFPTNPVLSTEAATQPISHLPSDPLAMVSEIVNVVEVRVSADATFETAVDGAMMGVSGQVRTGEDSRVRIDIDGNAVLRAGADTVLGIEAISSDGDVPVSLIRLEQGHAWLGVTAGTLQVLTPMGVVSMGGAYAIVEFVPGEATATDDTLTIECFDGPCVVQTAESEQKAGRLERLILSDGGQQVVREPLGDADVQSFIAFNPEASAPLFEALLESSPPTSESTSTETPQPTDAATQAATATLTNTSTPTLTPTVRAGTTAAPGSVLGKHIVRAGDSMYCIGRAYGVLPDAIARANGMSVRATILVGKELIIPAVQWRNMGTGPVCVAQFQSPYVSATVTP